jgi:hypothetical protein
VFLQPAGDQPGSQGGVLRKLALLTSACAFIVLANIAAAQQIDFTVGGSTLFSPQPYSASQAYPPPAEKGGTYPSASVEVVFQNHFGFSAEGAFRYHEQLYNGYQRLRPVLYDVNGVFARRYSKRYAADFMAGVGAETLIFYNQFGNCNFATCPISISGTHFLLHAGGGLRYYFWRSFFVRPEAHYYFVPNNFQFHSDNVLRLGASIGCTFGGK